MTALAARQGSAPRREAAPAPAGRMRLSGLISAMAERQPTARAFVDQADRESWSGRPPITWTFGVANVMAERLAAFFAQLGLEPGSAVGVCLPNGSEACLTLLALERAGLVPCILPVSWGDEALAAAVEAGALTAVITQGMLDGLRPAEGFCRIAARYFGLRFICAFGPHVPDGVVDLDRVMLEDDAFATDQAPEASGQDTATGLVTYDERDGLRAVYRSSRSGIAAALTALVAIKAGPGDRILTLLAQDDHASLATGLVASLVSGASLEAHGLFSGAALLRSLADDPTPTYLVAPAWLEGHLAATNLPDSLRACVLVHRAPTRFRARSALRKPAIDVLAFGETALLARARGPAGEFALNLQDHSQVSAETRNLLRTQIADDGCLAFGGLAADVRGWERGRPVGPETEWHQTSFRPEFFKGIIIGVN